MTDGATIEPSIVLFDGVCNLCNSSVQFILKRDRKKKFRFASMQSEPGQALLKKKGLPLEKFDTFVLIQNGKAYTQSTAALRTLRQISWPWPLLYPLILVPAFLRNAVYTFIARRRYRWFGKKDSCALPKPEWRDRFLEGP